MDTPIIVALIAAAAGSISFLLTKSKERDATWRNIRLERYTDLVTAMSEAVGASGPESRRKLVLAANYVGLVASAQVMRRLTTFLTAIQTGKLDRHDEYLTDLMHAIREDLNVPDASAHEGITFNLWSSGKSAGT